MIIKLRFNGIADQVDLIDTANLEHVITQADFVQAIFRTLHADATYAGFKVMDIAGLGLPTALLAPLNGCFEVMYQMAEAIEMVLSYYSTDALESFIEVFGKLPTHFGQFVSLFGGVYTDPAAFVQRERANVLPGVPSFEAVEWEGSWEKMGYANQAGEVAHTHRVH
ncbi:hypothetical protein QAO71_17085 (plasmid) [Halopseudomonas sp. SMJS2]|uniref:hypothetical protein n=1 Tax=Halopseudomonas sp. SMJS2 TaxID=3041098 RepID=UPI002452F43B|nr:hypothetical protein [Halopseudomonas sp. SMJS2]WGK63484.1 hypothetical protein QAO71_17085 [Halopseudomonas sp. SMJS2]